MNKVEGLTLSHDSGALKVQNHGDKICLASDMGFVPLQLMKHGQMVTCVSLCLCLCLCILVFMS